MGRTAESTIVVVAGNKLRLDVPITGDPAPTVVWTKAEKVKPTCSPVLFISCYCLSSIQSAEGKNCGLR